MPSITDEKGIHIYIYTAQRSVAKKNTVNAKKRFENCRIHDTQNRYQCKSYQSTVLH